MKLFLRLVTLSVLVVPVCLELRSAAERGLQARQAEAGMVSATDESQFKTDNHRRLFQSLQSRSPSDLSTGA